MIIAQISDTHLSLDDPACADRIMDFERCVAAINRLEPLPDVVVHTGDLTHNGKPAEYELAGRILGRLQCPFFVIAGNRDDRAEFGKAFPADRNLLPGTLFVQYCVDSFPIRLIGLDTLSIDSNQGDFCQIRADNLRSALAEVSAMPTAIFMHHPPFEVRESNRPFQFAAWESVGRIGQAIDGQEQVVGIFCGHSHRDTTGKIGTVPINGAPSVAVDLQLGRYPVSLQSVPLYKLHHFDFRGGFASEIRAA